MLKRSRSHSHAPVGHALGRLLILALVVTALALPAAGLAAPTSNPEMNVTKTAVPTVVLEPGGPVTFTVVVENVTPPIGPSDVPLTITALSDNIYGNIANPANPLIISTTCSVPQTIISYQGTYACSFVAMVSGPVGSTHTDVVSVTARTDVNDPGTEITRTDDATVTVIDNDGAIGDYIWYDANNDGHQNVIEPGIGNVTVDLWLDDGDGIFEPGTGDTLLDTTMTDQDGGYLFTGLEPGVYFVDVTDTKGILTNMVLTGAPQSGPDPRGPITLAVGQTYREADFGYYDPPNTPGNAIIGDSVWYDADGDGAQDPGEPGIPGVTVCATLVAPPNTQYCDVTDINGQYTIEVPPGSYNVAPTNAPTGYNATTTVPLPVTVIADQQYLDADFGYDSPNVNDLGSIGGTLWDDKDNDGVLDLGEPPLAGVSVDVMSPGQDGLCGTADDYVVGTATTDPNGNYTISGLPYDAANGTKYCVVVSDTQDRLHDYTPSTVFPVAPPNDGINHPQPYEVTLINNGVTININDTTADFAYVQEPALLGTIGNQVWVEYDGNGIWEPEKGSWGVEGVTLDLRTAGPDKTFGTQDDVTVATTTTGASGDYVFTSLLPGQYIVVLTDTFGILAGYSPTIVPLPQGVDNQNQTTTNVIQNLLPGNVLTPLALLQGASIMWADFGFLGTPNAVTVQVMAAEVAGLPVLPLVGGILLGIVAAVLVYRRRYA